ncbi:hypothetical protein EUX98_g3663 [Antrodiella citrinella]|uniref:Thioesterase domain-containing protein n=1 Tax=Antrodiella citrinella TaxID=2447956 RepID=A0A4S4MX28_9APHY|nr:hypothetical protein EUX98_g3663 [Antrodiella citrinella]
MPVISRIAAPNVVRRIIRRLTPPYLRPRRIAPSPDVAAEVYDPPPPRHIDSVRYDASDASTFVIENILGHLWDDVQTLRACSLTCHWWRNVAQPLLYRSIQIKNRGRLHHFENIAMLVPKTRPWITEVRLLGDVDPAYGKHNFTWVKHIDYELSDNLPHVVSMRLSDFEDTPGSLDESFILGLACFSEINECRFSEETLWSIICAFPQLRHLTIRDFRCMEWRGNYHYPPHSRHPQVEQTKGPITGLPFPYPPKLESLKVVHMFSDGLRSHYELQSTFYRFVRNETVKTLRSFTWESDHEVDYAERAWSINTFLYELQDLKCIDMQVPLGIPLLREPHEPDVLNLWSVETCHWYAPSLSHLRGRPAGDDGTYFPHVTTLTLHIPDTPLDWTCYRNLRHVLTGTGTGAGAGRVWYPKLRWLNVRVGFTWASGVRRADKLMEIFGAYEEAGLRVSMFFKEDSDLNSQKHLEALEHSLHNLPILQEHRRRADAEDWYEARPYTKIPEERRVNSLTAGALRGPGRLALPPLVRSRRDETESLFFLHVGRGLCGHEGIIHGGLLATLLDESLGRIALLNLPDKIGVTANLNLNYRAPTRADQFIVIKTRLLEQKGRKVVVAGSIEDLQGTVLVEASAIFIQPKYAKLLNTKQIREYMGAPPNSKEPIVEGAVAPVPMPPDVLVGKDPKVVV